MIYVIHPDIAQFQCFVIDSKEARRKLGADTLFHFDQRPKSYAEGWAPLEIAFAKMSRGKNIALPDITLRNGRMFLNEKACAALRDMLEPHGELLPVTYDGETGYLFNILALADATDALDEVRSSKNEYQELQSLAFHEERLEGVPVFRTAFDDFMGVYCQDALKEKIEQAGLKGVTFSPDLGNIYPPDPNAQTPTQH